jgi:hypothetical protein
VTAHLDTTPGRGGAPRCPRRVQRRNIECDSHVTDHSFSPLNAGWEGAARHRYQHAEIENLLARSRQIGLLIADTCAVGLPGKWNRLLAWGF